MYLGPDSNKSQLKINTLQKSTVKDNGKKIVTIYALLMSIFLQKLERKCVIPSSMGWMILTRKIISSLTRKCSALRMRAKPSPKKIITRDMIIKTKSLNSSYYPTKPELNSSNFRNIFSFIYRLCVGFLRFLREIETVSCFREDSKPWLAETQVRRQQEQHHQWLAWGTRELH